MPTNTNEPFERELEASAPEHLSDAERARVHTAVEAAILAHPTPSPYVPFAFVPKTMLPLALVFVLLFGVGGTAAASDAARPGDFLFPVDRAVEDLRLSLASDKDKEDLRIRFADERLNEFDSIIDEEFGDTLAGTTLTEAEADIFTNETLVTLEAGDRKVLFSTDADTREEIIAAIRARFDFSEEAIDAVLVIETEDRASRAEDGAGDTEHSRMRVENALAVLNEFFLSTRGAASTSPGVLNALEVLESRLLDRSSSLPEEVRARVEDDRARFEVEDEHGRTRIEIKDGEIRVKTDDDSDDDNDDSSSGALEIEAEVFSNTTEVKVELNDRKATFSTSADTREEVIDEILERYDTLTRAEVDAALRFEVEDRESRVDDEDDTSGSGSDDKDENKDEDHSGKGKGGGN